ncbi:MAG: hypothetical protein ACRD3F_13840 [Acidobacteriaceae bacterium]
MRNILKSAVIASAMLFTTAAFAANRAVVNVPFNFETHGKAFPAGQYIATVDLQHNLVTLSSATDTKVSARWIAGPADSNPFDEKLTLTFDDHGGRHELRTVQLGSRITSRLDAPSSHESSTMLTARVGGQ